MNSGQILQSFHDLPVDQKLAVARQIQDEMADLLFDELDQFLPDIAMSENEIMDEVLAVRYARPENDQAGY
jgi:hypothetical protein